MSTAVAERPAEPRPAETTPPNRRNRLTRTLTFAGLGLLAISIVRQLSGAEDLTSGGQAQAALAFTIPIAIAGLSGLWSERAGIMNIGLEGMMILGTWGAGFAGYQWGPWAGLVFGMAFAGLGGLLHATATITFGVNHIISGVAINILGLGITQFLSALCFEGVPGGSPTQSPPIEPLPTITIPGSSLLGNVEAHHWFLISDFAGVLHGLTNEVSVLTIIALVLIPLSAVILWRTPFGLRLRLCGEHPEAAEALGINVYRTRYIAVIVGGVLVGLAGVFLAEVAANIYREGQTGGRGYIGLAALMFGNWYPAGTTLGAALFGYADALQLRSGEAVHSALLLVAGLTAVLAVVQLRRRNYWRSGFSAAASATVLCWYLLSDSIPSEFVTMTPYIVTLMVLVAASQRLRPPAADGLPYRRGGG